MRNIIKRVTEEHRQLNALTDKMDTLINGLRKAVSSAVKGKLRELAGELIRLLKTHDKLEKRELFPLLIEHIPEANQWQVRMVEVQDELIFAEAQRFRELFTERTPAASAGRIKELGTHLVRWINEHIEVEERHLFPLLEKSPAGRHDRDSL